jgi:hypothetical protein
VHVLNVSGCKIRDVDVSALSNVHTLNLRQCEGITDESALNNVHTLNTSNCKAISDVSALTNVFMLDISLCYGITDVCARKRKRKRSSNFCTLF